MRDLQLISLENERGMIEENTYLASWRLGGSIPVPALSWRAWRLVFLLAVLVLARGAFATEAAPGKAADPAIEARAAALETELRCLVCQNQTLADSNAPLAVDLRNQIRERMREGASDRDILDFMVARYGDFVLYRPPLKATTVLLWAGPALLLIAGLAALFQRLRRRRSEQKPDLTSEESTRAAALLANDADGERR
jgi:cytochrome c-type biogenesis protein CcmH